MPTTTSKTTESVPVSPVSPVTDRNRRKVTVTTFTRIYHCKTNSSLFHPPNHTGQVKGHIQAADAPWMGREREGWSRSLN